MRKKKQKKKRNPNAWWLNTIITVPKVVSSANNVDYTALTLMPSFCAPYLKDEVVLQFTHTFCKSQTYFDLQKLAQGLKERYWEY